MLRAFAIGAVILAAVWGGAWAYGRHAILAEIDAQRDALAAQGGAFAYRNAAVGGFPFAYRARLAEPSLELPLGNDGGERLRWTAPALDANAALTAPSELEIAFPPTQTIEIGADGTDGPRSTVDIRSEGLRAAQTLGAAHPDVSGSAASIGVRVRSDGGESSVTTLDASGKALRFDVEADGNDDNRQVEISLDDMLTLIARRLDVPGGLGTQAEIAGGRTEIALDMRDRRAAYRIGIDDARLSLGGLAALDLSAERLALSGEGATRPDGQPSPFSLSGDLTQVRLSEALWEGIDPQGALPRDIRHLRFEASGVAVIDEGAGDPAAFLALPPGEWPVTLQSLDIASLSLDALGVAVEASGAAEQAATGLEGALTMRVTGLSGFIEDAVRAGVVPPQQAVMARLMLENFARPGEAEDELVFDLALRNGLSYVNGIPVGPAPQLP